MADGAKVADVADMADMADGVAVANGVAVTDGVPVADGVAVTEGGATVTGVGNMLVAEFGGGTTLGGGTALVSVDIFVRGGMWRSVNQPCNEQSNLITTPGFFFKLRRYPGLFFLIF